MGCCTSDDASDAQREQIAQQVGRVELNSTKKKHSESKYKEEEIKDENADDNDGKLPQEKSS